MHGMVHITGGGFLKICRTYLSILSHAALIDTDAWTRPEIFAWLQQAGNIAETEMLTTFNCGIGFVLIVAADDVAQTISVLQDLGEAPSKSVRLSITKRSHPLDRS